MLTSNLYFMAIVPPVNISEDIVAIQRDFSERFHSSKSLKVMPHITIKAPFERPKSAHEELVSWFSQLRLNNSAFTVELSGFGCFENSKSPVMYIRPVENESLRALQKMVIGQFAADFPESALHYHERAFAPHLTVAYRDLTRGHFIDAWKEYKQKPFYASFTVSTLYLYQHDGQRWNEVGAYHFD